MRTFAKLLWALVDFRVFLWMTQQTFRAFLLKKTNTCHTFAAVCSLTSAPCSGVNSSPKSSAEFRTQSAVGSAVVWLGARIGIIIGGGGGGGGCKRSVVVVSPVDDSPRRMHKRADRAVACCFLSICGPRAAHVARVDVRRPIDPISRPRPIRI